MVGGQLGAKDTDLFLQTSNDLDKNLNQNQLEMNQPKTLI
jgi:hypothetical protein